ncbi:branched-chain amino acid ABC transporter permease [Arhodomonas sp. SL1]|uniref:branched-chain amino acid ABC transporter permease n=1 Tax=Arhodomonas sp. SL1 TaxID=3425691 RepID=UPI003F885328
MQRMMSLLRYYFPVLSLVALLLVAVTFAEVLGSLPVERAVTEALIYVVIVVGLYVFIGNSGIISLGHVAFIGVAAYATAWQTCCPMLKPITMSGLPAFLREETYSVGLSAATSVGLAGLVALASGLVLMRLSGIAASIATLAALFILNVTYSNWDSVTMGTASVVGLPYYVTPWVALLGAVAAIIVAYVFQRSPRGLMLRASREDAVAASAVGVSLYWNRLLAFVISGMIAGLGGVLHAHYLGTVSVDTFFLKMTFLTLAMLVVGGMGSLAGAVVGVLVVHTTVDVFRRVEEGVSIGGMEVSLPAGTQELILAAIMLLILVFRKEGLMGGKEIELSERT